ncbi:MAG: branched-chain amino acid transporter ATPase/permease [Solirubrobacterales bacterium]|nr:branched-chain amino acid transporter ATPase/permease [Solirubrobacterales bacterium]
MEYVRFLLLGVSAGGVYAALALALAVTHRASGVVNFAIGAVALYTSYTYALLRQDGGLLNPLPGFSRTVSVGGDPGLAVSIVLSLIVAGLLGLLLYVLIFRPLRSAPPVAKSVVTIGVLVTIQALLVQRVGTQPIQVDAIIPRGQVTVGGGGVPSEALWFAGTIVALAAVLGATFRFTRFGLATRGVAESEKGALVTGLSPDRIAAVNWALSTAVAGLAGILIAPIVVLVPDQYTLFVVPALAAALVAGFSNLGIAVAAGLTIGMIQSELTFLQLKWSWLPQSGMPELVPLVLVLAFLVVRGQPLPERGALIRRTIGAAPNPRRILPATTFGIVAGVLCVVVLSGSYRDTFDASMAYAIIALGLVVVTGYAGQVSLAQLTIGGAGAFMLSRLSVDLNIPFPFAPLLAAACAAGIGVLIGLPALRIRGLPVAVVTLALAVSLNAFWFNNPDLNGGTNAPPVASPSLFGIDLSGGTGGTPRVAFGLMCLAFLLLSGLAVAWLRRSRLGAAMLAVRANERSAAAAGVSVARTKITAFAIGSFLSALGGCMLAYQQGNGTGTTFAPIAGLGFFAIVYLAGITSISGGVVAGLLVSGGIFYNLLNRGVDLGDWYATIAGIGLILTVIMNPEGVVRPLHALADHWHARRRREGDSPARAEGQPTASPDQQPAAVPASPPGPPLLEVSELTVIYGGVVAVDSVSLTVGSGEIVGLIGPNGAGKTTLIDGISGFVRCRGSVTFDGRCLDDLRPFQRIRSGLGRTFQGVELYEDLSVEDNVLVGEEAARHGGDHVAGEPMGADGRERHFATLGLTAVRDRPARELSPGRRQLVSIARALAGRPRLILLDEPAGGLDSTESLWLAERLERVREAGTSILLVDHDMSLVMGLCDRIYVLDVGSVIACGTPAQIAEDRGVSAAYLGSTHQRTEETVA